jgi:hypothetical protein
MTTGLDFAAIPRSANQTSPGVRFIEQIENFLLDPPGAAEVEEIEIRQLDDLADKTLDLQSQIRLPFIESLGKLLRDGGHGT